jgi:DNA-binding transcriptional MerR regulator
MEHVFYISEAACRLDASPSYLRALKAQGRILRARRGFIGRIYSEFDFALLKSMGIGSQFRKLKQPEEVLGIGG